jgi:hypothetical protein
MIQIYVDITAPLYWWKEFDTYKIGTVANSCSTMHKIHAKEFTLEDFSCEHLTPMSMAVLSNTVNVLNIYRNTYLYGGEDIGDNGDKVYYQPNDKHVWHQMIQLLPSSYNQIRTVMLNYEVLHNIYTSRKYHKLNEWREMCEWIETLPYSEIITTQTLTSFEKDMMDVLNDMTNAQAEFAIKYLQEKYPSNPNLPSIEEIEAFNLDDVDFMEPVEEDGDE